jgi:predicted phosphodiesterase
MKLGLITDIHEQSGSLERVLAAAQKRGCEAIACLGDITGWDPDLYPTSGGRSASYCIRLIRENCSWIMAGNHDHDEPAEDQDLTDSDIIYLKALPDSAIISPDSSRVLLSHYLYPDFTGSSMVFVRRMNQLENLFSYLTENDIQIAFAGHDHPAGVGFGYPAPKRRMNRIRRAFHYLPYHRYELDGQQVVCLIPAVATRTGRPGFSVWDTVNRTLDVIQLAP